MRIVLPIVLAGLIVLISIQLYQLYNQKRSLLDRVEKVNAQAEFLNQENEKLTPDIGYFSDFRNLVKEFKALFNYKNPGEKLIIVVPKTNQ